ncbi:MAG: AAA family ATPase [Muribaculum sp.]|nr:AAA family ATPase [Muribaculum sp.]
MASSLRYPVGIQSFSSLREGGYAYVDKTKYINTLLKSGKYFFLSRPRRFGKSLFLSTLEAYFMGKRELFKGLDIDKSNADWTPRPVIKMSLNTIDMQLEDALRKHIGSVFKEYEDEYGIAQCGEELSRRFEIIIRTAFQLSGQKVTILVAEYDAPLLNTIEDENLNITNREILKSIFSVLKNADEYIHFAIVTGVSRFSHTSLFSGANNLKDISL